MTSKAILVKYIGPTDNRGTRLKATDEDGNSVTMPRHHNLELYEDSERAAKALCTKMDWQGKLAGGSVKGGYVFVFVD